MGLPRRSRALSAIARSATAEAAKSGTIWAQSAPIAVPAEGQVSNSRQKLEAPPGFEPGMEVLQISLGCQSCCLVLVSGPAQHPPITRYLGVIGLHLDYSKGSSSPISSPGRRAP